jgi:hypothetical protein
MSTRRNNGHSVSLFHFLAVLVCAMGALIFLLLVTTRRLRERALERAQVAVVQQAEPQSDAGIDEPAAPVLTPAGNAAPIDTAAPEPPSADDIAARLRQEWSAIVADLERERGALADRLRKARADGDAHVVRAQQLQQRLQDAGRERDTLRSRRDEHRAEQQTLARQQGDAERTIEQRRRDIEQVRVARAAEETRFSILPYDGRSGTARRPILIECTPRGLTFAAEGITLTPEQVNGFPPAVNPLLAGTLALMRYWEAHDRLSRGDTAQPVKPYVLLVVRPGGTIAYYVARKLLEKLEEPFGYELVTESQEFAWPDSDPQAVAQCREAIDALLAGRERLLSQTGTDRGSLAGPWHFMGPGGEFHLDEVERLRGSAKSVYFGGQRWERDARTTAAGTGGRVQEAPRTASSPPQGFAPVEGARALKTETRQPSPPALVQRSAPSGTRASPGAGDTGTLPAGGPRLPPPPGTPAADQQRPGAAGAATAVSAPSGGSSVRTSKGLDLERPQFGIRELGSHIGLERDVGVAIDAAHVQVAEEPPIAIGEGMSREELQLRVAESLDAHVRGWGRPPKGFFWRPALRFKVLPGGNQYHERLAELARQWELRSSVEPVLE